MQKPEENIYIFLLSKKGKNISSMLHNVTEHYTSENEARLTQFRVHQPTHFYVRLLQHAFGNAIFSLISICYLIESLFYAMIGSLRLIFYGLVLIFYGRSPRLNQGNTFLIQNHRAVYSYFIVCTQWNYYTKRMLTGVSNMSFL